MDEQDRQELQELRRIDLRFASRVRGERELQQRAFPCPTWQDANGDTDLHRTVGTHRGRKGEALVEIDFGENANFPMKECDKNQNCDGIIAYKYLPLRQINDPRPCKKSVYLREPKGFANIACSLFA